MYCVMFTVQGDFCNGYMHGKGVLTLSDIGRHGTPVTYTVSSPVNPTAHALGFFLTLSQSSSYTFFFNYFDSAMLAVVQISIGF